jgi:ABC-2 type transport system ATP-binding protein
MSALDVSHLRKNYGDVTVVDDLTFQVKTGEIFGLIGPNGAGKSTAMMMIIGLLKSDAGSILLDGQPFNPRNADMRSLFGVVPQELAIYPDLTAIQNLRFFGGLNGLQGQRLKQRVDAVLELTGLTKNADHTPATFSGGMSRRLNFGIALLHEPKFVVLDEPTVGIDPQSRSNLLDCVRDLAKRGVGVLYASHYMEEVEAVCDRVAIIDHGRLLKQGTINELLDRTRIELCLRVASLPPDLVTKLAGVADVRTDLDGKVSILIRENLDDRQDDHPGQLRVALEILENAKIPLLEVKTQETSLETLFLSLTGRKLRD